MKVAQHLEINDFDQQVLELEAAITRIDLWNDEMKQALKEHVTVAQPTVPMFTHVALKSIIPNRI